MMDLTALSLAEFSQYIRKPDPPNVQDVVDALAKSEHCRRETALTLAAQAKRIQDLEYQLALEKRASEIVASAVQVALNRSRGDNNEGKS